MNVQTQEVWGDPPSAQGFPPMFMKVPMPFHLFLRRWVLSPPKPSLKSSPFSSSPSMRSSHSDKFYISASVILYFTVYKLILLTRQKFLRITDSLFTPLFLRVIQYICWMDVYRGNFFTLKTMRSYWRWRTPIIAADSEAEAGKSQNLEASLCNAGRPSLKIE